MKRIIVAAVIVLVLSSALGPRANAEMANEGSGPYKSVMSFTFKAISIEKERLYMTYDVTGAMAEAPPDSPLYNATFHSLGALHAIKGAFTQSGFIVYNHPSGDKVYATFEGTGKFGGKDNKKTFTFVGGTGKCAGIEGGGEITSVSGLRHATKETRQSMSVGTFHWKIPQTTKK